MFALKLTLAFTKWKSFLNRMPHSIELVFRQMVYFHTNNPNLGVFWSASERALMVGKCFGHSEYFTAIWYGFGSYSKVLGHFGVFYHEKSGNPDSDRCCNWSNAKDIVYSGTLFGRL
jgi:hypothetical protein